MKIGWGTSLFFFLGLIGGLIGLRIIARPATFPGGCLRWHVLILGITVIVDNGPSIDEITVWVDVGILRDISV